MTVALAIACGIAGAVAYGVLHWLLGRTRWRREQREEAIRRLGGDGGRVFTRDELDELKELAKLFGGYGVSFAGDAARDFWVKERARKRSGA